jgi:Tfp pilus assembly protein PilO
VLKNKTEIIFIITGLAIAGAMFYFYQKKNKSFLDMSELDKKKFVEEDAKKRLDIQNDPNLTQQQKIEAEERLNKINLMKLSEEEMKALADFNIKRLVDREFQLRAGSVSFGSLPF